VIVLASIKAHIKVIATVAKEDMTWW